MQRWRELGPGPDPHIHHIILHIFHENNKSALDSYLRTRIIFAEKKMKKAIPFFLSQAISLFGSQIVAFAMVWYVTLETKSGLWVALLSICSFLPQFLMSFIGGALADRQSKKALIIGADTAIGIFTLALVLLIPNFQSSSQLRIAILITAALRSIAAGIQTPAVGATIPLLVEPEQLMRANGLNSTFQSIANFAAPAAAGALMSILDLRWTLMIDIATAILGITILSFVFIPNPTKTASSEKANLLSDIRAGLSYSAHNKLIASILLLFGVYIFLSIPAGFLANLFVSRHFGDSYLHLTAVEIIGFAGMLLGGILMSSWGGFKNRFHSLLGAGLLFGLLGSVMGLAQNFILYLATMLLYGIMLTAFQTSTSTILQENVEEGMMGRVFGLLNSMYSGFLPIGMAIFGPLADVISLRLLIVVSNILLMLVCALVIPRAARKS